MCFTLDNAGFSLSIKVLYFLATSKNSKVCSSTGPLDIKSGNGVDKKNVFDLKDFGFYFYIFKILTVFKPFLIRILQRILNQQRHHYDNESLNEYGK